MTFDESNTQAEGNTMHFLSDVVENKQSENGYDVSGPNEIGPIHQEATPRQRQTTLNKYFHSQSREEGSLHVKHLCDYKLIKEFKAFCLHKALDSEPDQWVNWFNNDLPEVERAYEILVCMMLTNWATDTSVGSVMFELRKKRIIV